MKLAALVVAFAGSLTMFALPAEAQIKSGSGGGITLPPPPPPPQGAVPTLSIQSITRIDVLGQTTRMTVLAGDNTYQQVEFRAWTTLPAAGEPPIVDPACAPLMIELMKGFNRSAGRAQCSLRLENLTKFIYSSTTSVHYVGYNSNVVVTSSRSGLFGSFPRNNRLEGALNEFKLFGKARQSVPVNNLPIYGTLKLKLQDNTTIHTGHLAAVDFTTHTFAARTKISQQKVFDLIARVFDVPGLSAVIDNVYFFGDVFNRVLADNITL